MIGNCEYISQSSFESHQVNLKVEILETADNLSLWMELPSGYDKWKRSVVDQVTAMIEWTKRKVQNRKGLFRQALRQSIDRLWFFSTFETFRSEKGYFSEGRYHMLKLNMINTCRLENLGIIPIGETFPQSSSQKDKYVLVKMPLDVTVRNNEGQISRMERKTVVSREGNLSQNSEDSESKMAISTIQQKSYVNHRTICLSDASNGCVFACGGRRQLSPNVVIHSELTESAFNAMSFNIFLGGIREGVTVVDRVRQYARERDWSHGEATREMANKFGETVFLPGGFTYEDFIDYLFSRFREYQECSQDCSPLLSDDWKTIFSAALVPRGMELNRTFAAALRVRLQEAIFEKLMKEIRCSGLLRGNEDILIERKGEIISDIHCTETYWPKFIKGLRINQKTKEYIRSSFELSLVTLHKTCQDIIDFAAEGHIYNRRLPLALEWPTMLIAPQVENPTFREQSFIHKLVFAAAFGSGILIFRLLKGNIADVVTVILAIGNAMMALGTMTNISRFKTLEEESGVVRVREMFSHLKKAVFSMMDRTEQNAMSPAENPLLQCLDTCIHTFQRKAYHHNIVETMDFDNAYKKLSVDYLDLKNLASFQETVARDLIADTFHRNSHAQEALVDVIRTVDEIMFYLKHNKNLEGDGLAAKELLARLNAMEGRFEESLQQGQVCHVFFETRMMYKFLCNFCCGSPSVSSGFSILDRDVAFLVNALRDVSSRFKQRVFQRELQDVMVLHRAIRGSAMESLIFAVTVLIFMTCLIFTIGRFCFVRVLDHLALLCAVFSSLGAVLAIIYLAQKLHQVSKLVLIFRVKGRNVKMQQKDHFRLVRRVIYFQLFLTASRFCAALAAVIVLVLSIALKNGLGNRIPQELPLWIAIGSIITTFGAALLSHIDMYAVQYQLAADLGPFICNLFRDEIRAIHKSMVTPPRNSEDAAQLQEQEAWAYTARAFLHEWRFDTVFSVERWGQIVQYIQSGAMNLGSNEPPPSIIVMEA